MMSSTAEKFDRLIGAIEDVIITEEFQQAITDFMDNHHDQFDYEEENKLCYMDIFQEYRNLVESFLLKQIHKQCGDYFDLIELSSQFNSSNTTLPLLQGEVIELIISLTDFLVFKGLILDHKTFKSGKYDHLNLLQVNSIQKMGK